MNSNIKLESNVACMGRQTNNTIFIPKEKVMKELFKERKQNKWQLVFIPMILSFALGCVDENTESSSTDYNDDVQRSSDDDSLQGLEIEAEIVPASEETRLSLDVWAWRVIDDAAGNPAVVEALDSAGVPLARLEFQKEPGDSDYMIVNGVAPLKGEVLLFRDGHIEDAGSGKLHDMVDALWSDFESTGLVGDMNGTGLEGNTETVDIRQEQEALTVEFSYATIQGNFIDENDWWPDGHVANATVSVYSTDNNSLLASTSTDRNGNYAVAGPFFNRSVRVVATPPVRARCRHSSLTVSLTVDVNIKTVDFKDECKF